MISDELKWRIRVDKERNKREAYYIHSLIKFMKKNLMKIF